MIFISIRFLCFSFYIFRHLAVDFQLYIIGLVVYFMIRNRGWEIKCATLLFFLTIGIISPIFHILRQNLDGVVAYSPE